MAQFSQEELKAAFGHVIRDSLKRGETVVVPGLGTFRVDRRPSEIEEQEDGQLVMRPPRDEVIFSPEAA